MTRWLDGLDKAYSFYAASASRLPTEDRIVNGRLPIARVPTTCGAGCGLLGATGIEILSNFFDGSYEALRTTGKFDQISFYELGRIFGFIRHNWHIVPRIRPTWSSQVSQCSCG